MKRIVLMIMLCIPLFIFAQEKKYLPERDSSEKFRYYYSDIINVDNANSNELYNRVKNFVSQEVKKTTNLLQDDKENGIVVIKGVRENRANAQEKKKSYWRTTYGYFQLKIQVKDNRYKFTFEYPEIVQTSFSSLSPSLDKTTSFSFLVSQKDNKDTDVNSTLYRSEFWSLNTDANIIINKLIKMMQTRSKDDF